MRKINRIIVHCTATSQDTSVQSILNYWKNVRGWKSPGYHVIIKPDGDAVSLLPYEKISNGARGFNRDSIHIAYIGGVDEDNNPIDNRTPSQTDAMFFLIMDLQETYTKTVLGHRDLPKVKKACPSFDVRKWLSKISL